MDNFLDDFTSEGTLSLIAGDDFQFTIESSLFDDTAHNVFFRVYDMNGKIYLSNILSEVPDATQVPDVTVTDKGFVTISLSSEQTAMLYNEDSIDVPLANASAVGNYKSYRYTIQAEWSLEDDGGNAFTQYNTIAYHKHLRVYKSP